MACNLLSNIFTTIIDYVLYVHEYHNYLFLEQHKHGHQQTTHSQSYKTTAHHHPPGPGDMYSHTAYIYNNFIYCNLIFIALMLIATLPWKTSQYIVTSSLRSKRFLYPISGMWIVLYSFYTFFFQLRINPLVIWSLTASVLATLICSLILLGDSRTWLYVRCTNMQFFYFLSSCSTWNVPDSAYVFNVILFTPRILFICEFVLCSLCLSFFLYWSVKSVWSEARKVKFVPCLNFFKG
jgi:hypothetical protein